MQETMEAEDDLPPGQKKWCCEYCTYLNWSSTLKCTMCRATRPVRVIATDDTGNIGRQDIYQLGSTSPPPDICGGDLQGKWGCHMCSYHNYPRSLRCTQCLTPRKRVSPSISSRHSPSSPRSSPHLTPPPFPPPKSTNRTNSIRSITDQLQPLHISVNATPLSHHGTTVSPESSKDFYNERNRKDASARDKRDTNPPPTQTSPSNRISLGSTTPSGGRGTPTKWQCLVCTYENWPKSVKCVLCGLGRGRTSPDQLQVIAATPPPARDTPSPEGAYSNSAPTNKSTDKSISINTDTRDTPLWSEAAGRGRNREVESPGGVACSSQGGAASVTATAPSNMAGANNLVYEKRLRQLRRRMRETDWAWLSACMGVVEGDANPVEAYLNGGGDPTRKLSHCEATLLGRPGVYDTGHTLVHLAIKCHREDLLATLLSQVESVATPAVKRVPSYVASDLAAAIRRQLALSLRQRKGPFPCFYMSDCATYTLPPEIEDLPRATQEQLYNELLDKDVQKELEEDFIINWSQEVTCRLGSRLNALWNRSAGDCLLDAVLQTTWGVFDRDNTLRRALSDSLNEASHVFYPRWKEWEARQAMELEFTLADSQWAEEWSGLLALASQPGASLEQLHIFCLAHVLRRPICIYGVKYVKSWRGENLGYAKFEGLYLPLQWDPSFCYRSPIALGYTRGHFTALVPPEPDPVCAGGGAGAAPPQDSPSPASFNYLPLMTRDRELLPIHFLTKAEQGQEEAIMRQWLEVCVTEGGILLAQQNITRPPLLVAQMTEEWLNYYRKTAQSSNLPYPGRGQFQNPSSGNCGHESSGEETDEE